MTLIFLSHLAWGFGDIFPFDVQGCLDRSDVSMVAEPNGKCVDSYPWYHRNATIELPWFLCKNTNTCIHKDARLECFHLII